MKGQIRLTELQKDSFGIIYYCIKNAIETCDALMSDKQLEGYVRYNLIRLWLVSLSKIKAVLDRGLGLNNGFDEQIKKTDTLGLMEVVKGYIAMSPEGRSAVEELFAAIKKDGEIKIEVV